MGIFATLHLRLGCFSLGTGKRFVAAALVFVWCGNKLRNGCTLGDKLIDHSIDAAFGKGNAAWAKPDFCQARCNIFLEFGSADRKALERFPLANKVL